jgi:hypothetical protein
MIELGTAKAGIITVGNVPISVFGWSRAITCNGPGELSIPIVIATAKSARPSRFHKNPNFLPPRVPEDTHSAAGKASRPTAMSPMPAGRAKLHSSLFQSNSERWLATSWSVRLCT